MYSVVNLSGKGRALIASKDFKAGEIVLEEDPAFLIVDEDYLGSVALGRLDKSGLSSEDAASLRMLVHVFAAMWACQGEEPNSAHSEARKLSAVLRELCSSNTPHPLAEELHRRLIQAIGSAGVSFPDVDQLLRKEACNSYGIMAPPGDAEERKLKGSGFFSVASLLNHDCLPNTARFDSFDRQTPAGMPGDSKLFLRALHDIPKGEELTSSYFPLTLTYQERQQRCSEQYGFACSCLRCQEEATWQESGSEDDAMDDAEEDHEDLATDFPENVQQGHDAELQGDEMTSEKGIDAAYIYVFLTKYVCEKDMCEGTLAPIMNSELYECNRCGSRSTEADFQRRLDSEE